MKENRIIDFRYAPSHAQVCIGLVDDKFKTIVGEDGSIRWGFESKKAAWKDSWSRADDHVVIPPEMLNSGFNYRLKPTILHRDKLLSSKQNFGDPGAAIVETIEEYEASTLRWTTFAWHTPQDARVDVVIWELFTKKNFTPTFSGVALECLGHTEGLVPILHAKREKFIRQGDDPLPLILPGEAARGAFFLVQDGKMDPTEATWETAQTALKWAKDYWKGIRLFEKDFRIPDPQIDAMLKSCARNILQAREKKDGVYTFQVGPTFYRGLWMVDGHFLLEAGHIIGRRKEAYEGLDAVLKHVRADGGIIIMPPGEMSTHEKETGIALATICRQCELMNDDDRLRSLWDTMRNALTYIRKKRAESYELGEDYPARGMFGPCMGDGGIGGPEPEYTTPVWTLAGLRAAYLAGKRLDLEGYEEFKAEFDDLMACFKKCIQRDRRVTPEGIPYFPQSMVDDPWCEKNGIRKRYEKYKPQTGTWALAQAIYPGEVFAPDDPIVTDLLRLLDCVDNTEGIPGNTGWKVRQAVWGYSSMFYALDFLYTGNGEKAVDYLYAFANHASPGRVWREEQALRDTQSEEFTGDMPHNWGSAMFILLVRDLLVMECGKNLELLKGLPAEWLPTEGNPLELKETPTRYGLVSLKIERNTDGVTLYYSRVPFVQTPEKLVLHWSGRIEVDGVISRDGVTLDGNRNSFEIKLYP